MDAELFKHESNIWILLYNTYNYDLKCSSQIWETSDEM